jgi:ABC-2 type transport system ATP-binding protein
MTENAIDIKNLNKSFGKFQALSELSMSVKKGEVHGFLGPNGAGKSTTIRVLLGLLKSDSGSISLLGGNPWKQAAQLHKRLAYVPGDVNLWPDLTGGESIDILAKLRDNFDEEKRKHLIKIFELDAEKKNRTYSKGNRQKVAIIAALCSDVDLYIFDEPTSGLDPLMESVFQEEVQKEKQAGKTILLSSHIMSEVEALADRISIIRDGTIIETGSLQDLRQETYSKVSVELQTVPDGLKDVEGVKNYSVNEKHVTCVVPVDHLQNFLQIALEGGIESLITEPPSLDEMFKKIYEEKHNSK